MTFAARETSVDESSPIELFEFSRGSNVFRYTSQGTDYIDAAGDTWFAVAIRRGGIESTNDAGRVPIRLRLPRDLAAVGTFITVPPASVMLVTLRRVHRGDGETVVTWLGRVLNADFQGAEVELHCEPAYTSLRRVGLRRFYQRNCTHTLYDSHCKADPAAHRFVGTVTGVAGRVVSTAVAAGIPAGELDGGFASWTGSGGGLEQRMILSHAGADVTLSAAPVGLDIGATILLHRGCDRTLAICSSRFANTENFGGFPFIPPRSVYDGNPTF